MTSAWRAGGAQGHVLGMYNLAMMQLADHPSKCSSALELLKKIAGVPRPPPPAPPTFPHTHLQVEGGAESSHLARKLGQQTEGNTALP